MQQVDELFPSDYQGGRRRFLALAADAGYSITSYVHDSARGSSGEELACDVARAGPAQPSTVLLISSGTHGVEGFCGSGCQAALLQSGMPRALPASTAVVLVHAVNPYGFARLRRTNEDNVDLNRNFVDHGVEHPNPAYEEIHPWLVPAEWEGPAREQADAAIARYIETRGLRTFQAAMTGGQYSHPDGLFYGGRKPAWSNHTWRRILREHCASARQVVGIDLHTGLGPSGVGEAICVTDEPEFRRAKEWFGDDVKWTGGGDSVSAQVGGSLVHGAHEELGAGRLTMIGLEYGTHPIPVTMNSLRAETWLEARGDVDSPQGRRIKQALLDAFYVNEAEWKRAVVARLVGIVEHVQGRLT